ncbi:MAG TPA: hypothetical protein VNV17_05550 [Solirubrobacteraceae bacterium]|jgi:hypothetical protein|nr:hypothetical protein [Solirubrobacteraceae bacterium]
MVHNPLRSRAQRKTSAMLTRVGWEPPQTWPVPRPDGAPLVFQTRLPAAEFVAADELPARRRRDALASVGGAIVPLEEAQRAEHVFLAAAICSTEADHGVLATMTAALAPKPLPFTARDGAMTGRRGRKKVKGMAARVTVIERQEGDGAGAGGAGPLVVQYAIRHRHGTLTLTFVTHGPGLAGNARRLFQNIVRGCHLGTAPLAAQDVAAQR